MPEEASAGGLSLTTVVILGGVFFLLAIVVALIILVRRRPKESGSLESRLEEYSERETPVTLEELEMSASFADRIVYPTVDAVSKWVVQFTPAKSLEKIKHNLDLADNPANLRPANFLVLRFVALFVLGGLVLFLMMIAKLPTSQRIMFVGISAALGYFLPVLWLGSKIRSRQSEIVKQLPDNLDLLTICVEAGLGFDQGVAKVVEKSDNELTRAFSRYLQEVRLGKVRREALVNMSDRMEVPDVTSFVAAIVQADQLGVSMAKILRIQSDQMRLRRRQRAEQKAHQAPIKMLFPMVFLTFPSIFIMLLGPAVLVIMDSGVIGSVV